MKMDCGKCGIICPTVQRICVRRVVGPGETSNFNCKGRDTVDASAMGAFPFVVSCRAFAGLTRNQVGESRPLSLLGLIWGEAERERRWHQT